MQGQGPLSSEERRAYLLGSRCFDRGEDDLALSHFARLLRTRRGFADVHYKVGVLFERRDDLASAAQCFEEAIHINPGYVEALLALAALCERRGDFDRAEQLTQRAQLASQPAQGALDPTTRGKLANLQAALADAYREAGALREALECYRKALDLGPDFHDIRHRFGIALRDAGLPDRALSEFRRVLRGNPAFLEAAVQLGLTYYTLGRTDEALRQWSQVAERDRDREDARMYLRLVRRRRPPAPGARAAPPKPGAP